MSIFCQILQICLSLVEIGACYAICDTLIFHGELKQKHSASLIIWTMIIGGLLAYNRQSAFFSALMLIVQIVLQWISFLCMHKKQTMLIYIILIYNLSVSLFELQIAQVMYYFLKESYWELIHWNVSLIRILLYAISIGCSIGIFYIVSRKIANNQFELEQFRGLLIAFIAFEVVFVVWFQVQLVDHGANQGIQNAFYLSIFLIFLGYLAYVYQIILIYKLRSEMVSINNRLLEKNYREMEQVYQNGLCATHDIRNHVLVLRNLLERGELEKAKEYLDEIGKPITLLEQYVFSENEIINLILNAKLMEASNQGIKVLTDIREIHFEKVVDYDLNSILSNILDNAIEACEVVDIGNKWLKVVIKEQGDMGIICVENSIKAPVERLGKKFLSKKENPILHGYGMKSVEEKVEKNSGIVEWNSTDEKFSAMITFFEK